MSASSASDWVRSVQRQCAEARVAFFYKQKRDGHKIIPTPELDGVRYVEFPDDAGQRSPKT